MHFKHHLLFTKLIISVLLSHYKLTPNNYHILYIKLLKLLEKFLSALSWTEKSKSDLGIVYWMQDEASAVENKVPSL